PAAETLIPVVRMLTRWREREPTRRSDMERLLAEVQGSSGLALRWQATGPLAAATASSLVEKFVAHATDLPPWPVILAESAEGRLTLKGEKQAGVWLAYSGVVLPEPADLQFLASAAGTLRVWLDGKQ